MVAQQKKTLLIERSVLGGAGVTNGALSSKTWWEISRETAMLDKHLKRFNMEMPDVDFQEVKSEVAGAVKYRIDMLQEHMDQREMPTF